jgi:hypothetical protein
MGSSEHGYEIAGSIKGEKIPDWLRIFFYLKRALRHDVTYYFSCSI